MRKLIFAVALLILSVPAFGQSKPQDFSNVDLSPTAYFGPVFGYVLDNDFVGATVSATVPFKTRYEVGFGSEIDPIEGHVALGQGFAYSGSAGAGVWFTRNIGAGGSVSAGAYHVTQAYKGDEYVYVGPIFRGTILGQPTRFGISYVREVDNHLYGHGIETSHLQGGKFGFDTRIGCFGSLCVHATEDFTFAQVQTQGNPVCDGSLPLTPGTVPCPRQRAWGGGVSGGLVFEFPRHRGHEKDLF